MQNRRDFIKQSCSVCFGLVGLGLLSTQAVGCSPLPIYKAQGDRNNITVPLASFTEKNNMVIVRHFDMEFDILLVKQKDETYNAMLMQCTHHPNPLTASSDGLFCAAHGSRYNLNGEVTQEPALTPLKKYKTEINNSSIIIYLKS